MPWRRIASAIVLGAGVLLLTLGCVLLIVPGVLLPSEATESAPALAQPRTDVFGADDWPHLRGPRYDGVSNEQGLAGSWPFHGPPVLWSRELGAGYSGCIVVQGKVFTQEQRPTGQFLVCLNAENGDTIWEYRYDRPWRAESTYAGPYATPTWSGGYVCYASPTGLVGRVDAATGKPAWAVPVLEQFGRRGLDYGYACTPLVEEGKVILPVGGEGASLVALNAEDGSKVWAAGDDPASYCPAYPITVSGRRQVVGFLQNVVAGFDLPTGRPLWKHRFSHNYDEHAAWPLYAEPDLMISAPFRAGARLYRLGSENATPEVRWITKEFCNDICSSVLVDGHVYGFHIRSPQARPYRTTEGQFKCLEFATGRVCWATERTGHASVLAADGKLILLNDTGTLILALASPESYKELGRTQVFSGDLCWTPPTLWRGRLLVRSRSRLTCLSLGSLETVPGERPHSAVVAPTVAPGKRPDWRTLTLPWESRVAPLSWEELTVWYVTCLIAIPLPAILGAWIAYLLARPRWPAWAGLMGQAAFLGVVFLEGCAAIVPATDFWGLFVFTWPVSVYAVFQGGLTSLVWIEKQTPARRSRWLARAVLALLLLLGIGYAWLCRNGAGIPAEKGACLSWSFLLGLTAAWPVAVQAARCSCLNRAYPLQLLWAGMAFSVYFWASGLLPACNISLID